MRRDAGLRTCEDGSADHLLTRRICRGLLAVTWCSGGDAGFQQAQQGDFIGTGSHVFFEPRRTGLRQDELAHCWCRSIAIDKVNLQALIAQKGCPVTKRFPRCSQIGLSLVAQDEQTGSDSRGLRTYHSDHTRY